MRALPAAVQAGLQSQAAYAFADAHQHFETALELWDQVPDAAEHATLSRAEGAAARRRVGVHRRRPGPGDRADPRGARPRSTRATTRSRLGCCTDASAATWRPRAARGRSAEYEQAVALVPPAPPSAERAGVLAAFGEALMIQARYRDSLVLCEEAIAIASQVGRAR